MKTFWIVLACGLLASVLSLICGLALWGYSSFATPQVKIIHQSAEMIGEGEDRYLDYAVTGYIILLDRQTIYEGGIRYTLSYKDGPLIWNRDDVTETGNFYLHRQIPLSELGLSSSVSLDDLEFGCKVTEFQLHPIYDTWHFIGELLVLLGAGFLIATIIIAVKSCRPH